MKKILIISTMLIIASTYSIPQPFEKRGSFQKGNPNEKIEELEKIKLIEILDADEETTVRFFSKRAEHREKMKQLMDLSDKQLDQLEEIVNNSNEPNDPNLKKIIDDHLNSMQKIEVEKKTFLTSLNDILTYEQIAKVMIFERKFRDEIRGILFRERIHKRK